MNCKNNEEEDDTNEATKNQHKIIKSKISAVQNNSDRVGKTALLKVELINNIQATKDNTYDNNKSISQNKRQVKKNYRTW